MADRASAARPRRVAFVSHSPHLVGGAEQALLRLLSALDRERTDPLLVVPSEGPLSAAVETRGIRWRVAPVGWWIPATHWSAAEFLAQLEGLWDRASSLERLLAGEGVELVHTNVIVAIEGALAAAGLALPHAWHSRGLFYERFPPVWFHDLEFLFGAVDRLADVVVCVSEAVRRQTAEHCRKTRIAMIHDGFAADEFLRQPVAPDAEFRGEHGIPEEVPLACAVGGIQRRKGLIDLIEAMRLLRERHSFVLLLAGAETDPEFAGQLKARIAALDLARDIRFLGQQPNIHNVVARCRLLIHPAHSEGLGLVLLEAMAASKPIVATRSGGPEEIVAHGETGLLVPPGEPRLLAEAIDALLSDPAKAAAMGRAGRARLRGFSLEESARRTQDLYDRLAATPSGRAERKRIAAELPGQILARALHAAAENSPGPAPPGFA